MLIWWLPFQSSKYQPTARPTFCFVALNVFFLLAKIAVKRSFPPVTSIGTFQTSLQLTSSSNCPEIKLPTKTSRASVTNSLIKWGHKPQQPHPKVLGKYEMYMKNCTVERASRQMK